MLNKDQIRSEFDKEFPACNCRNGMPPHFDDSKVNRDWVFAHLSAQYEKLIEEVIGEDEHVEFRFMQPIDNVALGRNNLRATIRTSLQERGIIIK